VKNICKTIVIIFWINCATSIAQSIPALERKVSVSYQNATIEDALNKLSRVGDFIFSYNPSILNANHFVSGKYTNAPVREIIIGILGESVETKGKGNYIILTKAAPATIKESVRRTVTISGYVTDRKSGYPLSAVSVYEKNTLAAVITNEFGFYKISLDEEEPQTVLFFSKRLFLDTLIKVNLGSPHFVNINLSREPLALAAIDDVPDSYPNISVPAEESIAKTEEEGFFVNQKDKFRNFLQEKVISRDPRSKKEGNVNVNNIKDTLYRDVQLSFVPFVGTNHKLSGNVINGYSFNILGGYSMGTSNLELGGLFNIDRGDVKYGQFAGLFNIVGGNTTGVQAAGLINLNRRKVSAIQFAGLLNANLDSTRGAQFAGLFNVNARSSEGAQFAGLFNVQPGYYKGSQFAGLYNISTHQMKGTQVASLFNYAHHLNGAQVGLFNYADSIRGIPIGLLSMVKRGYHKIELSADEVFYMNVSFRTGVRQFYNILSVGIKPETWNNTNTSSTNQEYGDWAFGYGVGTAPRITKWLYLNLDLTANHVSNGNFTNSLSLLNKMYLGFDFQIRKKFSITAGATLNAYLSDPTNGDNPVLFTDFTPRIFSDHNFSDGNNMKMWWGAKVGIRFL
jgi:hypothetical protein